MNTKHEGFTPGPWYVEADGKQAWKIRSEDFGGIAYVHDPIDLGPDRTLQIEANARLIAAAPDLLAENERLRALLILATETIAALDPDFDSNPLPIHDQIKAALASKDGAK